jgi:hypothetical protein
MKNPTVRQAMFPYGMAKNEDGTWTFFNRSYKTVGTTTDDWSDWNDPKHKIAIKGLTAAKLKKLDVDDLGTGNRIYFYNDGCVPTHSAASLKAYLDKLAILIGLKAII